MKNPDRWFRILLPALVVFVITGFAVFFRGYYRETTRLMREEVAGSVMGALDQAETNLRYRLEGISDLSTLLLGNPILREILDRSLTSPSMSQQILDYRQLSAILNAAENDRNVARIKIYVDPGLSWSNEHVHFFGLDSVRAETWYGEALDRAGRIFNRTTWASIYLDQPSMLVMSFVRRIEVDGARSPEDYPILVVDVPETVFSDLLSRLVFSQGERVYLIDRDMMVISSANQSDIGQFIGNVTRNPVPHDVLQGALDGMAGDHEVAVDGRDLTILHRWLGDPDWALVTVIDSGYMMEKTRYFSLVSGGMTLVVVLGFMLLGILALSTAINESMVRKIRNISLHIAETGNPVPISLRQGELSRLEASVASLLESMHELVEENYRTRERAQESRLVALQAQINPHFLYNTLDSINWMATRRGAQDIADVVIALSRYFRMTLNHGKDVVSLKEELDLVEAYLVVQKNRFGDIFREEHDVDAMLLSLEMPKLTLQPLVENALLHGLQHRRQPGGLLRIEAHETSHGIRVMVWDNGGGMSSESLESVRNLLAGKETSGSGSYGLSNVQERLRLFYGPSSSITLESNPWEGTRVCLEFSAEVP